MLSELICDYRKEKTHKTEEMKMNEKQIKQIESQLPQGERIDRMYTAFEGGIRVITKTLTALKSATT